MIFPTILLPQPFVPLTCDSMRFRLSSKLLAPFAFGGSTFASQFLFQLILFQVELSFISLHFPLEFGVFSHVLIVGLQELSYVRSPIF